MLPTFKSRLVSIRGDQSNIQVFLRSYGGTRTNTKINGLMLHIGGVRIWCVPRGLHRWAAGRRWLQAVHED